MIAVLVILGVLVGILLLSLLWYVTGHPKVMKYIAHDMFGWHKPTEFIYKEGINTISTCKYCGKKIIQDSQGNWF